MNKYLIVGTIILLVCVIGLYFYKFKKTTKSKLSQPTKSAKSKLEGYEENLPPQPLPLPSSTPTPTGIQVLLCYANWCGHCPEVKEWYVDLVANTPLPNVTFTMCEEQDLPDEILGSIPGFPSILIFSSGQMQRYPGNRTREDLLRYLKNI